MTLRITIGMTISPPTIRYSNASPEDMFENVRASIALATLRFRYAYELCAVCEGLKRLKGSIQTVEVTNTSVCVAQCSFTVQKHTKQSSYFFGHYMNCSSFHFYRHSRSDTVQGSVPAAATSDEQVTRHKYEAMFVIYMFVSWS